MFEKLQKNLAQALRTLRGHGTLTDINIATTVKEIRRALIKADVHYKVAKQVTDKVKAQALGSAIRTAVSPGQLFTKIVHKELTALMGGQKAGINLKGSPAIVLLAGLQGAGKTTLAGKLAAHLQRQQQKVLLVACDVHRPAAVEQLQVVGQQLGAAVFAVPGSQDALAIAQQAVQQAQAGGHQVVIVDTAGRLAGDEVMMAEVAGLKEALQPSETLFVVDAMMGQDAVNTAQRFNERLAFDGVVLTKLDGDARAGAALSVRMVVDKPIKFISTGEKLADLEVFHPDRMARRILGMGDVVSLVERAEEVYDAAQARQLEKKVRKNALDFNDLLGQLRQLKKMGNLKDLVRMVPGLGHQSRAKEVEEGMFKPLEVLICSMTPQERGQPDLLDRRRRARLARGSGLSLQQVNAELKRFDKLRKMMRRVGQQGPKSLLESLGQ